MLAPLSLSAETPLPTKLRLTKKGTCAFTLPACRTWTTCQPPSPSGTVICELSVPSAAAVAFPSGIDTKLQHVPGAVDAVADDRRPLERRPARSASGRRR